MDNEAKRIEDENEVQEDLVTSLTSSPGDDGTSSISKSTVVITSSQILGSNEESSSARDENGDAVSGDENPNNTQSMIVVPSASDEVSSSMTISMPNEIEQSIHEANTSDNGLTIDETSNKPTSDDVERDYEIPNFEKSIEAELAAKTEQSTSGGLRVVLNKSKPPQYLKLTRSSTKSKPNQKSKTRNSKRFWETARCLKKSLNTGKKTSPSSRGGL